MGICYILHVLIAHNRGKRFAARLPTISLTKPDAYVLEKPRFHPSQTPTDRRTPKEGYVANKKGPAKKKKKRRQYPPLLCSYQLPPAPAAASTATTSAAFPPTQNGRRAGYTPPVYSASNKAPNRAQTLRHALHRSAIKNVSALLLNRPAKHCVRALLFFPRGRPPSSTKQNRRPSPPPPPFIPWNHTAQQMQQKKKEEDAATGLAGEAAATPLGRRYFPVLETPTERHGVTLTFPRRVSRIDADI